MAVRPTIREYELRLQDSLVHQGGGSRPFRGAEVQTSIVVPLLNSEETLEATLQSALLQEGDPEIVVVDGGSTDGTLAILQRFQGRIHRWLTEPDDGMYDAINKGIALSTGRIIHILNGDDLLPADSVRLAMDHYGESLDDHCLMGALGRIDAKGNTREVWTRAQRSPRDPEPMPYLHPSWYVPRAIYASAGLYLPYFRIAADHEYAFHLWDRGVEFVNLEEILALFREGGMSTGNLGIKEALETTSYYLGRPRAAAVCGEALWKKTRYSVVSKILGPERTANLWTRLKAIRAAL